MSRDSAGFPGEEPQQGRRCGRRVMGAAMAGSPAAESRFGMTEPDDLPDDLRERIGAIAAKSGFVPNIFRALGHRPAELRAFLDYHDALMDPPAASSVGAGSGASSTAGASSSGAPSTG